MLAAKRQPGQVDRRRLHDDCLLRLYGDDAGLARNADEVGRRRAGNGE
jgi:hypothetical protein